MKTTLRPIFGAVRAPLVYNPCRHLSTMSPKRQGPLAGTTVVSLEQAIAAPFCTRHWQIWELE